MQNNGLLLTMPDLPMDKEELIKFWKPSAAASFRKPENFTRTIAVALFTTAPATPIASMA